MTYLQVYVPLLLFLLLIGSSEAFLSASTTRSKQSLPSHPSFLLPKEPCSSNFALHASSSTDDLDLLKDALLTFQSDSSKKLLEKLRELRSSDNAEEYLNKLLEEGPDRPLPVWATALPLSRFSHRARLASLKRTLDSTTPPPEDDTISTQQDELRRRRRALVALLQSLASTDDISPTKSKRPAIRILERKARQEQSGNNRTDLLNRRPADLETPKYTVVQSARDYEIRSYDSFAVCSVEMNQARPADSYKTDATISDPKMAGARAFGALAGYLFGKNQQESAMKMTTPVLTSNYYDNNKQMSFVLPSDYWKEETLDTAPKPLEGSGVTLKTQPPANRAVAMFGGYAARAQVDQQKEALLEALSLSNEWEMVAGDQVALAQYNDPFTPPWKRLNEVSIEVQPKQAIE